MRGCREACRAGNRGMIKWGKGKRGSKRFKGKRKRWKEGEGGGEEKK